MGFFKKFTQNWPFQNLDILGVLVNSAPALNQYTNSEPAGAELVYPFRAKFKNFSKAVHQSRRALAKKPMENGGRACSECVGCY